MNFSFSSKSSFLFNFHFLSQHNYVQKSYIIATCKTDKYLLYALINTPNGKSLFFPTKYFPMLLCYYINVQIEENSRHRIKLYAVEVLSLNKQIFFFLFPFFVQKPGKNKTELLPCHVYSVPDNFIC